ncbi:putative ABC transporter ATP-binding protein [Gordonia araii NBRC 100433]|uniref:Putative ABC transporter ATP-binding protein n=1 Tax=Gordonia araii NBRC 100433 TaxID=1073574 RepID=G7H4V3_9ACTN|nr:ATP-binding cassette domain-containing protein [Gordonia araii]NNG97982.1 ATP-binding cassette domain-containing protein [Gordonia araii NBRC 100433]GAB10878.1 putative ABC transporter ATP-binding protein [Gordonia araii NBRC 100433]
MIEISGVTKAYGEKKAVDDVSLTAVPGGVTYLLGPNGAGKSTVMRMIAGLTSPDSGTIAINGRSLRRIRDVKHEIGFSLSAHSRNPNHTAIQHLRWQARLAGIGDGEAERVLAEVGLEPAAKRLVGGFSLGMLQRLGIASALLGDPAVLVLDEPANGLDVEGVLWLRDLFGRLTAEGKTLLVASHSLGEVEITASWIVIMGRGRVLCNARADDVLARAAGPRRLESIYLELTRGSVEYSAGEAR